MTIWLHDWYLLTFRWKNHQIGVFHPKVVEEFVHQPNDLVSENSEVPPSPVATQNLANKDLRLNPNHFPTFRYWWKCSQYMTYMYIIYMIYIYMNQYEKSRKKWNYTRIFCHWKTWIGPLFGVLNTCYCHWCILLLFWNILYFTRPRFQIKQSQWEIETCNETTHHDMVLSAVCQLGQRNLFVFSQKYILKTHKFNKHQYVNRYFGTKIIRLKSQFAIFSGMSVTLFLENKQSYTQSQSYINTPCVCCQVALHSRWDLTFKAVRNETNDRPWNIWRYDYTPHRKPQTSTTNPSSWTKQLQHTHRIRLLCLYLDEWLIFMVNEGKYNIHGCYGYRYDQHCLFPRNHVNDCFFLYQPTLDPY